MEKNKISKQEKKIKWEEAFEKLIKYACKKYDYTVEITNGSELGLINFTTKKIIIKQINNKENMTYVLLHEIGHIIQLDSKIYRKRVEEVQKIMSRSSLSFRIAVLYEEMDAWNEAYDLGKKLRMPIDRKRFESYKSRCLKAYMMCVLNTNQKSKNANIKISHISDNIRYEPNIISENYNLELEDIDKIYETTSENNSTS